MDLFIIRHAWAFDRDDLRWPNDDLRPLTPEGQKRFAGMVDALVGRGMKPGIIASSPLVRCVETAKLLAVGIGRADVVELEDLRPGGNLAALLRWTVRKSPGCEQIAWVGHAPDVERFTAALIGDGQALIRFAKGSVAAVRFDGDATLGAGELRWLVTAKILEC